MALPERAYFTLCPYGTSSPGASEFYEACAERESCFLKREAENLYSQALLRPFPSLCTGYPLAGCSSAEPASVSPGMHRFTWPAVPVNANSRFANGSPNSIFAQCEVRKIRKSQILLSSESLTAKRFDRPLRTKVNEPNNLGLQSVRPQDHTFAKSRGQDPPAEYDGLRFFRQVECSQCCAANFENTHSFIREACISCTFAI